MVRYLDILTYMNLRVFSLSKKSQNDTFHGILWLAQSSEIKVMDE